jgi:hypothetical protein
MIYETVFSGREAWQRVSVYAYFHTIRKVGEQSSTQRAIVIYKKSGTKCVGIGGSVPEIHIHFFGVGKRNAQYVSVQGQGKLVNTCSIFLYNKVAAHKVRGAGAKGQQY